MRAFVQGTLIVAYPVLTFWGLNRFGARTTALALLAVTLLNALGRWAAGRRGDRQPESWTWLAWPCLTAAALVASLASDDHRFMLAAPALINAGLLLTFATSLATPVSLVERFASWYVSDLRPEERRYCRSVTLVWCAFFVLNGALATATALWAPLSWWTLYNGGLAYLLIGLVFAVEFVVRKYRFRRFSTAFYDRWLKRVLPMAKASNAAIYTEVALGDRDQHLTVRIRIPTESGYFAGHFPGKPILPGVVQLTDILLPAIEQAWPQLGSLSQIKRLKFKELIVPGDRLEASVELVGDEARFRVMRGERECALGVLDFAKR